MGRIIPPGNPGTVAREVAEATLETAQYIRHHDRSLLFFLIAICDEM